MGPIEYNPNRRWQDDPDYIKGKERLTELHPLSVIWAQLAEKIELHPKYKVGICGDTQRYYVNDMEHHLYNGATHRDDILNMDEGLKVLSNICPRPYKVDGIEILKVYPYTEAWVNDECRMIEQFNMVMEAKDEIDPDNDPFRSIGIAMEYPDFINQIAVILAKYNTCCRPEGYVEDPDDDDPCGGNYERNDGSHMEDQLNHVCEANENVPDDDKDYIVQRCCLIVFG